jgi:formylglycine-generating enzyme
MRVFCTPWGMAVKRAALLALILALACDSTLPPIGQIVLYVSTDAPLPPAAGSDACARYPDVPALFDTVQFDVWDVSDPSSPTLCPGCSRRFPLDCDLVDGQRASIGIVPPPGSTTYVAEVRVFRAIDLRNGQPRAGGALDAIVALPAIPSEGIVSLTVDLPTDGVGTTLGAFDAPAAATPGLPAPDRSGTWPSARRVPCSGVARDDEACIPGGAFWMGNPEVVATLAAVDANEPRLVVLAPFFLDVTEVQVAPFRASGAAHPAPYGDFANGDPYDSAGAGIGCKFSSASGDDDYPVNCITWRTARDYCTKIGKDLPSEAQFEYAASGTRSATFPWGEDDPTCADATFAHGATPSVPLSCSPQLLGPLPVATGALDRVAFRTNRASGTVDAAVFDLAGNVREWALDVFDLQQSPCWSAPLLHDPVCQSSNFDPTARPLRGGGWRDEASFLRAATRHYGHADGEPAPAPPGTVYTDDYTNLIYGELVGFRCARPDR